MSDEQDKKDPEILPAVKPLTGVQTMLPLHFQGPSRQPQPPPLVSLGIGAPPAPVAVRPGRNAASEAQYDLPNFNSFQSLLDDPNADLKDLQHQLTRLMGQTAIVLFQESHAKNPSFNRAQTGSRAVEALRALAATVQDREKSLYKDRIDFDNPRLQYFVDALWDLIEDVMKQTGLKEDVINNFFLMLQSKLPKFEETTRKVANSVSFNAAKHGTNAERSDAALMSAKRAKAAKDKASLKRRKLKKTSAPKPKAKSEERDPSLPPLPTADDHA